MISFYINYAKSFKDKNKTLSSLQLYCFKINIFSRICVCVCVYAHTFYSMYMHICKHMYTLYMQLVFDSQWHITASFYVQAILLPGKSHGRRSLVGCSPWGRSESDMTERLHFHFSLSCIGEGNGNPLQCSCLEDSRDRAAIYGVAQSWLVFGT